MVGHHFQSNHAYLDIIAKIKKNLISRCRTYFLSNRPTFCARSSIYISRWLIFQVVNRKNKLINSEIKRGTSWRNFNNKNGREKAKGKMNFASFQFDPSLSWHYRWNSEVKSYYWLIDLFSVRPTLYAKRLIYISRRLLFQAVNRKKKLINLETKGSIS